MVTSQPTAAAIAAGVVRAFPGLGRVGAVRELRRGRNNVSWVMNSSTRGLIVCKVLVGVGTAVVERLHAHQRLCEAGVPVPALVGFEPVSEVLGGRLLVVSEYLPGRDAADALPGMSAADVGALMRGTGSAVASLHGVRGPQRFGDGETGILPGPSTWPEVVEQRLALLNATTTSDPGLTRRAAAIARDLAAGLDFVVPATAHLDLFLPNLLVDDDRRFLRLLDLEHVRVVDPVADMVKPGMWMFGDHPEWADDFVAGYCAAAGSWPAAWEARIAVASGLELLSGCGYWQLVGDRDMFCDYESRLQAWADTGGAAHAWAEIQPRISSVISAA